MLCQPVDWGSGGKAPWREERIVKSLWSRMYRQEGGEKERGRDEGPF